MQILIDAIRERRILSFNYDGLAREVEPHAVGTTSKGKLVLRGFQPDGETQRGLGWKLFTVDKIEDLFVRAATFAGPRDGYRMGDKQIANILEQLHVA